MTTRERVSDWCLRVGMLTQYLVTQAVFGSRARLGKFVGRECQEVVEVSALQRTDGLSKAFKRDFAAV
jgi:hypothetical protein